MLALMDKKNLSLRERLYKEAPPGFEPGNNGFAIRRLRPLGYGALDIVLFQTNKLLSEGSLQSLNDLINRSDRIIIRRFLRRI